MAGSLKQFWWLHGDWPLTSDSQITKDHFEDLRKMVYLVQFPGAGHYITAFGSDKPDGLSSLTKSVVGMIGSDFDIGAMIIRTPYTQLWTSGEEISKGCWRTVATLDGGDDSYTSFTGVYEALQDLSAGANTTSPDSSANWRLMTNPPALLWVNTVKLELTGEYLNPVNFPLPDIHPGLGQWNQITNNWRLYWDLNKYHSFDVNSYDYYHDSRGTSPYDDTLSFKADQFLPAQIDSLERNFPWVYQGDYDEEFLSRKYRFKSLPDKLNWNKEAITHSARLGAIRTGTGLESGDSVPTTTPYWVSGGVPGHTSVGVNEVDYYNQKFCDGLQAMIETIVSDRKHCWPVNQTYIDNWEAVNDDTWDLGNAACHPYPYMHEEYWGCNGSAFELILSELGTDYYDWYFDTNYIYWPDSVQEAKDDFEGFQVWRGAPLGTWRRTWKHTMGRVRNGFMRSSEMGAPTSSGYDYAIWDGAYSETIQQPYWCGIHTAEFPDRDEFDTTFKADVELSASGKSGLWAGGTSLPPLNKMITCFDPADESTVKNVYVVKIVGNLVYFSDTVLDVSYADEGKDWVKVGWNTNIQDRHDGIAVDCDTTGSCYPKYKLHWKMVQHAYKVLENVYRRYDAGVTAQYTFLNVPIDDIGTFETPLSGKTATWAFSVIKSDIAQRWPDEPILDTNGFVAGWRYSGTHGHNSGGYSLTSATVSEFRCGLKIDEPTTDDEQQDLYELLNSKPIITVKYQPREESDPDGQFNYDHGDSDKPLFGDVVLGPPVVYSDGINHIKPVTIAGVTIPTASHGGDTSDVYTTMSTGGLTTDWTYFTGSDGGWSVSNKHLNTTQPVNIDSGDPETYNETFIGSGVGILIIQAKDLVGQLDYDAVPTTVFNEDDGRFRIPAGEPEGTPDADTNPPVPNPAQVNLKGKLSFEIHEDPISEVKSIHTVVTVTASPAEDLEGSTPVWYRAISKDHEDTVINQSWGSSPICSFEPVNPVHYDDLVTGDSTSDYIGRKYTYTGTPTALDAEFEVYDDEDPSAVLTYWKFEFSNTMRGNQSIFAGDKVWIPDVSEADTFTIVQATASYIIIARAEEPAALTSKPIFDVSGYNLSDWNVDDLSDMTVAVQYKDDEGNETEISEFVEIEPADAWPLDVYLAEEELNFYEYLESLNE